MSPPPPAARRVSRGLGTRFGSAAATATAWRPCRPYVGPHSRTRGHVPPNRCKAESRHCCSSARCWSHTRRAAPNRGMPDVVERRRPSNSAPRARSRRLYATRTAAARFCSSVDTPTATSKPTPSIAKEDCTSSAYGVGHSPMRLSQPNCSLTGSLAFNRTVAFRRCVRQLIARPSPRPQPASPEP
jgi:hypothetical protein